MAIKITKNKSSLPVKIKKVHITGLDGFDENDLIVAFKTAGVSDVSDFRSLNESEDIVSVSLKELVENELSSSC